MTLMHGSGQLRKFCEKECHVEQKQLIHTASGKKIKAVIVVHVFGNLADMESIMDIAEEYHLKIIEDATEALGSHYTKGRFAGKYAGTIGDFGAYSFNGNKIITTGGGAVTAKDAKTVAQCSIFPHRQRMIHIIIFIMKSDIIIA